MQEKIKRLAAERRAIILAHNYQPPEIQQIADLCGDSLELSIKAAATDADLILFCGVHFMAETASILSPQKTVLLPRANAGCPMAEMVTPEALQQWRDENPKPPIVTYVNSSAAVKALSTVCCTSANVVAIVSDLPDEEIMMVPDRNLARYAASQTGKKISYWDGYCPIHDRLTPEAVGQARAAHPDAVFMAHPECRPEVLALADEVMSTSGMLRYAAQSEHTQFIVGTEVGILHPMQQASPTKQFFAADSGMLCPDMKKISLADVAASLENLSGQVQVPEEIRRPALQAVEKMLAASN
jgi:quinolinate synthase